MATDFQLTAEIVLTGIRGLGTISQQLSKLQLPASVNSQFSQFAKNVSDVNKSVSRFGSTVNTLGQSLGKIKGSTTQAGVAINRVGKNTIQAVGAMENFGRTVGFVTTRLIGFRIASGLVIGFGGAIRNAVGEAIDFERQLVKIAQVTDKTVPQLARLSATITDLSIKYGISSKELLGVSKVLAQTGLSARDTRIALEALAKSTLLPTFGDMAQTTEGAIAIMNQFNIAAKDTFKVLSIIDTVTGKLAVEASDVVIAVQKAGGIFAALNQDVGDSVQVFSEFLAIFASIRQTTRESASNIAVGMRSIFARIQRKKTIDLLEGMGVAFRDVGDQANQLLRPIEILDKLSDAFEGVNARNLNIGEIVQALGGTRQVAKVLPMIFGQELRQRALRYATQGQTDAQEKLNKALDTLQVRMSQVRQEFVAFIRDVVQDETFKLLAGQILEVTSKIIGLAQALRPLIPYLAILSAIKVLPFLTPFGKGIGHGLLYNPLKPNVSADVGIGAGIATGVGVGTTSIIARRRMTDAIRSGSTFSRGRQIAAGFAGGGRPSMLPMQDTQKSIVQYWGREQSKFNRFQQQSFQQTTQATQREILSKKYLLSQPSNIMGVQNVPKYASSYGPSGRPVVSSNVSGLNKSAIIATGLAGKGGSSFSLSALGKVAGIAGITAAVAAPFVANAIGTKTKGRSAYSGALTGLSGGALLGAGIGSVVPVIGTGLGAVVGALVGALGGAVIGVKDFNETLKRTRLDDASEKLETTFDEFNKGIIDAKTFNQNIIAESKTRREVLEKSAFRERRITASDMYGTGVGAYTYTIGGPGEKAFTAFGAKNREELLASTDIFLRTVQKLAESGSTVEDVYKNNTDLILNLGFIFGDTGKAAKEAGTDLQKFYQILSEDPQVRKVVEESVKVGQLTKAFDKLNIQLDFAVDNMEIFGQQVDAIFAGAGTVAQNRISASTNLARAQGTATFGGIASYNPFKFLRASSSASLKQALSDNFIGGEVGKQVMVAREAPSILRTIASTLNNTSAEKLQLKFVEALENKLPNAGKVLSILTDKVWATEEKDPLKIYEELIKDLEKATKPAVEQAIKMADGLLEARQTLRAAQDTRLQLELQYISDLGNIASSAIQMNNDLVTARGGRVSLGQQLRGTGAQLNNLGVGTNVKDILQNRMIFELKGNVLAVNKTTMALNILSNRTDDLAKINQKIVEAEQRRSNVQGGILGIAGMGADELFKLNTGLRAMAEFQQTGRLTPEAIDPNILSVMKDWFGKLGREDLFEQMQARMAQALVKGLNIGGPIGAIGGANPGQAAPGLVNAAQQLQQQIVNAQHALLSINKKYADAFLLDSKKVYQEIYQNLTKVTTMYDTATQKLGAILQNSKVDITVHFPETVPVLVTGGGALASEISDAVAKRVAEMLKRTLPNPTSII